MALTHLVDTSLLTRLRYDAVRAVIEAMAAAGSLARAGITDLEIGCSARSAKEGDQALDALDAFELIESTAGHQRRARQVQRLLAAKDQRGRKVPDLLIAAAAEETGLVVLHYDADFGRITAVTGQRAGWVVRKALSTETQGCRTATKLRSRGRTRRLPRRTRFSTGLVSSHAAEAR